MKVTSAKEITVTLELNYKEAHWLRGVMQNYFGAEKESQEDAYMRRMFFDAINSELKKRA